jgi:hypothetical protein
MTDRDQDSRHDGPASQSPYPVSRLAPAFQLVDVAREIQLADSMLSEMVAGKLEIIAEQIRNLQAQARAILSKAEVDAALHRATCRFNKRPGQVYHLYERADGRSYISMLSPAEWGTPPHRHCGGFRLEADMSWTAEGDMQSRDHARAMLVPRLRFEP